MAHAGSITPTSAPVIVGVHNCAICLCTFRLMYNRIPVPDDCDNDIITVLYQVLVPKYLHKNNNGMYYFI